MVNEYFDDTQGGSLNPDAPHINRRWLFGKYIRVGDYRYKFQRNIRWGLNRVVRPFVKILQWGGALKEAHDTGNSSKFWRDTILIITGGWFGSKGLDIWALKTSIEENLINMTNSGPIGKMFATLFTGINNILGTLTKLPIGEFFQKLLRILILGVVILLIFKFFGLIIRGVQNRRK